MFNHRLSVARLQVHFLSLVRTLVSSIVFTSLIAALSSFSVVSTGQLILQPGSTGVAILGNSPVLALGASSALTFNATNYMISSSANLDFSPGSALGVRVVGSNARLTVGSTSGSSITIDGTSSALKISSTGTALPNVVCLSFICQRNPHTMHNRELD